MNANARISFNDDGNLYIGREDNSGYIYFQDMASQDGTDYWLISQAGDASFKGTVTATTFSGALSGNADTATTASKLGSSSVGSGTQHFYLNEGTATASSSTVGGTAQPMYLSAGTMTAISATVGSTDTPVYLNGGTITSCGKSFGSYLPLSGGTMTGSIITPDNDDMGIIPSTNNYGQIGSSTKKFYRMYATTFYGSLSGNASTASTWNTTRTLTVGNTGKSVNGSADVSWSLAEIGALPLTGGQLTGDLYVQRTSDAASIWARYYDKTAIRMVASSSATFIQCANYAWNSNVPMYLSGPSGNDGSTLYLKFSSVVASGGITMYSDVRKKNILSDELLSVKSIADAPLFAFNYKSDEEKRLHTGTSAQYWHGAYGDMFGYKDEEGFYTLEYQNLGVAMGISLAREIVKYESKTDKKIRLMKKKINDLEARIKELEGSREERRTA